MYGMDDRYLNLIIGALAGILCGLVSTFPYELAPIPCLALAVAAGLVLGVVYKEQKAALWPGVLFGFCLTVTLLFSRFDGGKEMLLGYSLLVAGLSILGATGGGVLVLVGARLRKLTGR